MLVTSGAIAAGIGPLGLATRPRDLATAQAAASVGQGMLVARYAEAFAAHGPRVGQVLLTAEDTVRRGHYRNAQRSLERLLDLGVVPVVNENDAVATDEIRFGDNDRLAALVSHLVRADAMVLLTDVDGLYDGPPSRPGARRIAEVRSPADIEGVEVTGRGSAVGTGGMLTKLESVSIATGTGIPVVLTQAQHAAAALALRSPSGPGSPRRAGGRRAVGSGSRTPPARAAASCSTTARCGPCRAGAPRCCPPGSPRSRASSTPATRSSSVASDGRVVARGLVAFESRDIPDLLGRSTTELRAELGEGYDREVVHRDDLVLVRRRAR